MWSERVGSLDSSVFAPLDCCPCPAEHLEELTGLTLEHMVRMCQHVGDEAVERAKTQVRFAPYSMLVVLVAVVLSVRTVVWLWQSLITLTFLAAPLCKKGEP